MQKKLFDRLHPLAVMLAITTLMIGVSDAQEDKKPEEMETVDVASLMQEASMALQSEDFEAAAAKFKQVTEINKKDAMAWHLYGYALHGAGELDEAIKVHKKAATFDEVKGISLYNLGCAYSLQGKTKESIQALHRALDAKFERLELFNTDSDLVNARKAKGFKAIANRVKNGGARPKFDSKKLIGQWKVNKGVRGGMEVPKERLPVITIDAKSITIPAGPTKYVMSYKIIDDKRPLHVDMTVTGGPSPEETKGVGILKKNGKQVTLCYDPTGAKRPKKFESTEENRCHLFVMTLEEDSDDDEGDDEGDDDEEDDDAKPEDSDKEVSEKKDGK